MISEILRHESPPRPRTLLSCAHPCSECDLVTCLLSLFFPLGSGNRLLSPMRRHRCPVGWVAPISQTLCSTGACGGCAVCSENSFLIEHLGPDLGAQLGEYSGNPSEDLGTGTAERRAIPSC